MPDGMDLTHAVARPPADVRSTVDRLRREVAIALARATMAEEHVTAERAQIASLQRAVDVHAETTTALVLAVREAHRIARDALDYASPPWVRAVLAALEHDPIVKKLLG